MDIRGYGGCGCGSGCWWIGYADYPIQSNPFGALVGGRKPGRPPLDWTPSRDRKLVRLIDGDVAWTDIAAAIAERDFTPSQSNCQAQWKKITDMPADQLRVRNPEKRARRKAQAMKAFEAYQIREQHSHPTTSEPPVLPPIPEQEGLEIGSGYSFFSSIPSSATGNQPSPRGSTPNIHAIPLLSPNGPTPGPIEALTPQEGQDIDNGLVAIEDSISGMTPRQADSPIYDARDEVSRKRLLPPDFNHETSKPVRQQFRPSIQSIGRGGSWPDVERSIPNKTTFDDNNHGAEERRRKIVADVEEKMGVLPGYLNFVKNRLSITRSSIASALSSSGSVRSRWSRKHSRQISHDLPELGHEPALLAPAGDGALQVQQSALTNQAVMTSALASPVLCELLVSCKSGDDDQTAEKMRCLIEGGADVNMPNEQGETPLHIAVGLGNAPACSLLLEKGADVYAKYGNIGISDYGKSAEKRVGKDSSLYVAIRKCRNLVKEHDPEQKMQKASKRAGKTRSTPSKRSKLGSSVDASGSMRNPPIDVNLGDIVACPPPATRGNHTVNCIGSSVGPTIGAIANERIHAWNSENDRMEAGPASQVAASPQTLVSRESSLGMYGLPQTPTQDFLHSRPQTCTSPKVREVVEAIEGRQSTKPPPPTGAPQYNDQGFWPNGEPSSTQLGPFSPNQNDNVFSASSAQFFSSENPYRHGHISHPTIAQQGLPAIPPQATRPPAHEPVTHISEFIPISSSPIVLFGYLEQGPDSQTFLTCPLPNNNGLEYIRQASNNRTPATVQIMLMPPADQSQTVQGGYDMNFEEPATVHTMPGTDVPAVPTWAVTQNISSNGTAEFDYISCNNSTIHDPNIVPHNPLVMNWPHRATAAAFELNFPSTHPSIMDTPNQAHFPTLFDLNSMPTYPSAVGAPNQMLLGLTDRYAQVNGNANTPPLPPQSERPL